MAWHQLDEETQRQQRNHQSAQTVRQNVTSDRKSKSTHRLSQSLSPNNTTHHTHHQTRLAYARSWHHVDLSSDPRPLGRLASQIALVLMGKHKPIYDPSTDCGDYVVCTIAWGPARHGQEDGAEEVLLAHDAPGQSEGDHDGEDAGEVGWGGGFAAGG